ncbi:MAG: Dehydrogenase short-chain alcohol dehydrogenase like protein [Acidobacteria bacterium]|nr:Dehydrogenase short-chain alcohol dehydrogenase like protein [Acidobacteriota bacterium]
MAKMTGKVAIVTGGASGIGSATVRLFVQEGARVLIADIQDQKGERLARELGESAAYFHADVSRECEVKAVVDRAVERFGRLDCIFNNAGFSRAHGGIEQISVEDWDSHMAVLLRGVFLGMKHAAPVMRRQASGSIINTSSVAGIQTGYAGHIYSAAKAGVIQLTRCVAMELGEAGVRVNCICPGAIATPIFGRAFGLDPEAADRTIGIVKAALAPRQPLGRAGLPEDIAAAALWLASDDSSFVNGHALVVDGGLTGGRMWSTSQAGWLELAAAMGVKLSPV